MTPLVKKLGNCTLSYPNQPYLPGGGGGTLPNPILPIILACQIDYIPDIILAATRLSKAILTTLSNGDLILLRDHPVISHCSHLLLKMKTGYKYKSLAKRTVLVVQKLHICEKVFWILEYCFYYSFTIYYCAIFYSLDDGLF